MSPTSSFPAPGPVTRDTRDMVEESLLHWQYRNNPNILVPVGKKELVASRFLFSLDVLYSCIVLGKHILKRSQLPGQIHYKAALTKDRRRKKIERNKWDVMFVAVNHNTQNSKTLAEYLHKLAKCVFVSQSS